MLSYLLDKSLLPLYIQNNKHDDWIWPFSLIPRRYTAFAFPMPPNKIIGNAEPSWHNIEPNYPLASDAKIENDKILSMDPVHNEGYWSVQSVQISPRLPRIPCYFTFSKRVFGKRLYFNCGLKPDVTYDLESGTRNWCWTFPETSLTWLKTNED